MEVILLLIECFNSFRDMLLYIFRYFILDHKTVSRISIAFCLFKPPRGILYNINSMWNVYMVCVSSTFLVPLLVLPSSRAYFNRKKKNFKSRFYIFYPLRSKHMVDFSVFSTVFNQVFTSISNSRKLFCS